MKLRKLGTTGLKVAPLILGGNVFGWTADRETSFAILDAFLAAGFNAIDTADVYNRYAPGLKGGESETVIGEWMKDRRVREQVVLITKGGLPMGPGMEGLGRNYLSRACEASLKRLQTDYIDVYMSHRADPDVPIKETLGTFQQLIDEGKVRHAGCSNYGAGELSDALRDGGAEVAHYQVIEPLYNLVEREQYEDELEAICINNNMGVIPYYGLAAGFLTGKYRCQADLSGSARAGVVSKFLNPRGLRLLEALDSVAASHSATPAQVALAWLMGRPSVTAPIASATTLEQLEDILKSAVLNLTPDDFRILNG